MSSCPGHSLLLGHPRWHFFYGCAWHIHLQGSVSDPHMNISGGLALGGLWLVSLAGMGHTLGSGRSWDQQRSCASSPSFPLPPHSSPLPVLLLLFGSRTIQPKGLTPFLNLPMPPVVTQRSIWVLLFTVPGARSKCSSLELSATILGKPLGTSP